MKKLLSTFVMVYIAATAFAQTVSFTSPNAESQKMLDSVKYVLPEFSAGMVIFNNGEQSNGALNINTIDPNAPCLSSEMNPTFLTSPINISPDVSYISIYP